MPVRTILAISISTLFLLLTGCASYPSLPQSEAASKEARAALIEVAAEVRQDPTLDEEQRTAQSRYLIKLARVIYSADLMRALLMLEKMNGDEEEYIDRSLTIVFTTLGDMVRLRGELRDDSKPTNPGTAEAFAQLDELALPE